VYVPNPPKCPADKAADIEALIAKIEPLSDHFYCFLKPRRICLWSVTGARVMATGEIVDSPSGAAGSRCSLDIELPGWLSELWLLDGHWKKTSLRSMSLTTLLGELIAVLAIVKEP
jgi:hypothetical protein